MIDLEQLIRDAVAAELDRRGIGARAANDTDHITVAAYAAQYSISERTVRDAIRDNRLDHVRIGRSVRVAAHSKIAPRVDAATANARLRLMGGKR